MHPRQSHEPGPRQIPSEPAPQHAGRGTVEMDWDFLTPRSGSSFFNNDRSILAVEHSFVCFYILWVKHELDSVCMGDDALDSVRYLRKESKQFVQSRLG